MPELRGIMLSLLFGSVCIICLALVISDSGSRYAVPSNNSANLSQFEFYSVANQTMGISQNMQGNLTHLPNNEQDAYGAILQTTYNTVSLALNSVVLVRVLISDFLRAIGMALGLPTGADATLSNGGLLIPMLITLIFGVVATIALFEVASMIFRYKT